MFDDSVVDVSGISLVVVTAVVIQLINLHVNFVDFQIIINDIYVHFTAFIISPIILPVVIWLRVEQITEARLCQKRFIH